MLGHQWQHTANVGMDMKLLAQASRTCNSTRGSSQPDWFSITTNKGPSAW